MNPNMGSPATPYLQVVKGSRDLLFEFWECLQLESSNLACRLTTRDTNKRNAKLVQRGSGRGHVTYFWNFGTPFISLERLELETSHLVRQCKMPIFVAINRSNPNRKYNSNMADARFVNSDVVITQPWIELGLSYGNLTCVDLDIHKRVLPLKPKPVVDFQLCDRHLKNRYDAITLP